MAHKKIAAIALFFLACSWPMFGQYVITNYQSGQSDNLVWCTTGGSSCYNRVGLLGGRPSAGYDGFTVAVDVNGAAWQLSNGGVWTRIQTWSGYSGVLQEAYAGSSADLLLLTNSASNNLYLSLDGGGVFLNLTGLTAKSAAINGNGDVWAVGVDNKLYHYLPATGWTLASTSAISVSVANGSAANGSQVLLINTSAKAYIWYAGAWTELLLPFTPRIAVDSAAIGDGGGMVILDNASNAWVSHDNGTTWYEPNNGLFVPIAVSGGGALNTFMEGSGTGIWHFNSVTPNWASSIDGVQLCLPLQKNCPNTTQHTITAKVRLPHQMGTGTAQQTGPSTTNFAVTAKDEDPYCDPFDFTGPECIPDYTPILDCPIFGPLPGETVNQPVPDTANLYYQRYKVVAVRSGPTHLGDAYQWYVTVAQWCSNGYWEPLLDRLVVENHTNTLPYYWDIVLLQYPGGPATQIGGGIPSPDGTNRSPACTGAYKIPVA